MPLIKSGSPSEIDIAYAAGLFDGEGSVSASASRHCTKNIRVAISVIMCDRAPIDFLASTFGGKVRISKKPTKSGKAIYGWHLYCRRAAAFLTLVLPYLRVKGDRAGDAILLASMMRSRGETRTSIISEPEIQERVMIAAKIKAANCAGNARVARYAAH